MASPPEFLWQHLQGGFSQPFLRNRTAIFRLHVKPGQLAGDLWHTNNVSTAKLKDIINNQPCTIVLSHIYIYIYYIDYIPYYTCEYPLNCMIPMILPARPELILSKAALPRHPRDTSLVRYGASHAALRGRGAPRQQKKKRSDLETINDIYV